MYTSLEDEMRAVLDTMKRQNKEIRRLILKEDGMKVIRCTAKSYLQLKERVKELENEAKIKKSTAPRIVKMRIEKAK